MDHDGTDHVQRLRAQIAGGGYVVDPQAVAEALLRRLLSGDGARDRARRPPPDPRL